MTGSPEGERDGPGRPVSRADPPDGSGAEPARATEGRPDPAPDGVADAEHNPSLNRLSRTLKRGATISAVMLFVTQLISLAQTVVVARLLTPAEIGVFTLGTLFANFLVVMADGGMRAALIQRETRVEDAANTAFWASLITGVAMSTGALAASPLLGLFFGDRNVALVAAATSGVLLIHSLLNVPEALMQRRFNFKRRLIGDPLTAGSFAVVTVTACALGYGVWGMVVGLYASQIATLIAAWSLSRWRPGQGKFDYRLWREMARYAYPMIVQNLTKDAREILQQSIVGRSLDISTAGQYRYGRRIGILPGQAIIQIASYVLFPAFARIADDAERFRRGFLRALRLLWTATVPLGAFLVAAGGPAIVVLLGPQWAPAGVFVAAMAGFGPGTALQAVGMESIKGAGASRRLHWVTASSLVVGVGGLIALLPFGLVGVGLAVSLEGVVSGVLALALARSLVGVSWGALARVLAPPLVAAVLAAGATWVLETEVLHTETRGVLLGLLFLVADGLVFVGIYLGVLAVLAPATVGELRAAVAKLRRRRGAGEPDDEEPEAGGTDFFDSPTLVFALSDMATERLAVPDPGGRHHRPDASGVPTGLSAAASDAMTTALIDAVRTGRAGRPRHALHDDPPAANGHPTNGHPTNGHPTNGHSTNGHHANGRRPDGHPTHEHPAHEHPAHGQHGPPAPRGNPVSPPGGSRRVVLTRTRRDGS